MKVEIVNSRRMAALTAILLTTCAAMPAIGQTDAAVNEAQGGPGFGEIIVTANRREEAIQKVPVAITAFNTESLREQSISNPYDLNGRVPSLVVTANGTQRDADGITIRGQGQTYLAPVGVVNYFAEVPLIQGAIIANQGAPGTFFDLDTLQVLRGPQGTLFGKNTTGGALLLGPKKPTNEVGGYLQGQIGNYRDREIEGALNLPIINDVLMVRVAAKRVDRDGYTKDVGTDDLTVSLPFQTPAFGPIVYNNSGLVIPGLAPNTGQARQPGVNDVRSDFRGKDYDDRHYWTARVGLLFRPVEGVENYLVGYYSKSHNNGTGQVLYSVSDAHPTLINLVANSFGNSFTPGSPGAFTAADPNIALALLARQQALGPRRVSLNNDQFYRLKNWSIVDTLSVELNDQLTVRNIFGYQRMVQDFAWDLDGSYLPVLAQVPAEVTASQRALFPELPAEGTKAHATNARLITEELQLQGKMLDDRLNFVLGGFYSKQKPIGLTGNASFNAAAFNATYFGVTTTSKAVYAQATLDMEAITPALEGLKLTGGIRKSKESFEGVRRSTGFVLLPFAEASDSASPTTWTAALDYQLSQRILLFGKVTRGFKAGGFNYGGPLESTLTFGPERVTSYEIGAKTDFNLGGMPVRFNISAYDLEYSGIQRANGYNAANGCPNAANPRCNTTGLDQGAVIFNAGSARVRGIELEGMIRPVPGFDISASYSYTDAKYLDYVNNLPADPPTGPAVGVKQSCTGPVAIPKGVGLPPIPIELTCSPFPFSPTNQFSITGRYSMDLGEAGKLTATANYNYVSRSWGAAASIPAALPQGYLDSYGVVNASVEWNSILGSNMDARLFVTNLTNETYRISNSNGDDGSLGYSTDIYSEPRMYGVSLRFRFGADAQ